MKKYLAEAIGTFTLVFLGCGTAMRVGCDASFGGGYVLTAMAFGLVIIAMAYSIGNFSGCHINPAVSLGLLLSGRMEMKDFPFYVISAAAASGTKDLMNAVSEALSKLPPVKIYEAQPLSQADWEAKFSSRQQFEVEVEDGVYYVSAPWLEPILRTVNMEDYSSLQYFQRVLRSSGIIDKLEEMGIDEGDVVNIFGFEFDYIR